MKTLFKLTIGITCFAFSMSSCQVLKRTDKPVKLETYQDSLSYSHGVIYAQQVKQTAGFNAQLMAAGIDEANREQAQFSIEKANEIITYEKKRPGIEFLAENGQKNGVKTTESGLQYKVIQEGTGAQPILSDKVRVHYKGTLIDGSEFDNSYKRGEPISFNLNRVIKGWTEGLQLMKEGGKYELYIPSELAYGERAMGNVIPAYSVLIFEIELLAIEK